MANDNIKKPIVVNTCPAELLFVQCPPPRCGRKAPSQYEIGRPVTTKPNVTVITTPTTKNPLFRNDPITSFPSNISALSSLKEKLQSFKDINILTQSGNLWF